MKYISFWVAVLVFFACFGTANAVPHRWTPTVGSPFGINVHTVIWDGNVKAVNAIKSAGIGWVRVDFNWITMEPSKGKFNWQVTDGIVNVAVKNQFNVFATLAYAPAWAAVHKAPAGKQSGPKNAADYEAYVKAVVTRYRGKVSHWGIWNEPNLDHFLWFPSGTSLTQRRSFFINNIVIPGIRAVRQADPDAVIVIGDMAHLGQSKIPAKDHSWQPWFEELLKKQGKNFDVIAHHTYQDDYMRTINGSVWPWEFPSVWSTIQSQKLTKKPFWLTEIGWKTEEVSEAKQASEYKKMLDTMLSLTNAKGALLWQRVFPYELVDDPNIKEKWGILKADWSPKAAWTTYRDYIRTHQPVAKIKPVAPAKTGQAVTFDGSGSSDPDGSLVKFSWDFDHRDGVKEDKSGKIVTFTFSKVGTFTVTLTVTDNHDIAIGTQIQVKVSQGTGVPNILQYDVVKAPSNIVIDGSLGEWSKAKGVVLGQTDYVKLTDNWGGTNDVSGTGYWMWSEKGLYFAARIRDQIHHNTFGVGTLWQGDSIQLAIDADNDRKGPGFDTDGDYEWGIALSNGKPVYERSTAPNGAVNVTLQLAVKRSGDLTTYELFIPGQALKPLRFATNQKFSLNFIVNDNDNKGRKGWLRWTPGIAKSKDPSQYPIATMVAGTTKPPVEPGPEPPKEQPHVEEPTNDASTTVDTSPGKEPNSTNETGSEPGAPNTEKPVVNPEKPGVEQSSPDTSTGNEQPSSTTDDTPTGKGGCACDASASLSSVWMLILFLCTGLVRRKRWI